MRQRPHDKSNNSENESDKKEDGPRRITRALIKIKQEHYKENQTGRLVWGLFAGSWWPGKYIRDNDYIAHAMCCAQKVAQISLRDVGN